MTHSKSSAFTLIAIAMLSTAILIAFVPSAVGQEALSDHVPTLGVQPMLPASPALPQFGQLTSPATRDLEGVPLAANENTPVAAGTSNNTAGYFVAGSGFLVATGSWFVPKLKCTGATGTTSISTDLVVDILNNTEGDGEAVGTEYSCSGSKVNYLAWFQVNQNSYPISTFTPKPGDFISANVSYLGNYVHFGLTLEDVTQGVTFTQVITNRVCLVYCRRTNAFWLTQVAEGYLIPSFNWIGNGDDYTGVGSSDWAADSTVIGPISDFGKNIGRVNRVNSKGVVDLATTALTTDGSSFQTVRKGP